MSMGNEIDRRGAGVAVVNGHRCAYEIMGAGPSLTLLHSVGLSTREGWRYQTSMLAEHFSVLSYDFRGLGESERQGGPAGVDVFVEDLEALLVALGIAKTAIMGISLGGFVAQACAIKRPDLVSALVLVSTASRIYPGHAARRANRNETIRREGMAAVADHQLESHFPVDFAASHPDVLAWYKAHYTRNDPATYIEVMDDLGRYDRTAELGKIRCPTLIVAGDADATSVAGRAPLDSANVLHRGIAGSTLAIVKGALHYPQIDHVDEFNRIVGGFLLSQKRSWELTPGGDIASPPISPSRR
jgi:pimeloyl-ACP methyl ester carboxylesterase